MAAWLLYVTVVGGGLGLAALLAERGLHRLGRPVRWVWLGAMAATVAVPLALLVGGSGSGVAAMWRVLESSFSPFPGARLRLRLPDGPGSARADVAVALAWLAASLTLAANVRLSGWTVRRNIRSWRTRTLGPGRVLVSGSFGPGVVGARRPRIVVPEWVLRADSGLKRFILLHEIEHVRARDTRWLIAGVALVALVPWCLPLWWQLHRLRDAIETDCDARVLERTADRRGYAHALVAVAGRRTRVTVPVPALAPRRGGLERRIRLITAAPRPGSRRAGARFLVVAAGLVLTLVAVPAPTLPTVDLEVKDPVSIEQPRRAIIYFTVEDEPADSVAGGP